MDSTPALRAFEDPIFATSPESQLLAGLQPLESAVNAYGERKLAMGQDQIAALNAQRLQQLKMQMGFQNVLARDKAMIQWHAAADAAKVKAQQVRADQLTLATAQKYANQRNIGVLPRLPNESDAALASRQAAFNTNAYAGIKKNKVGLIENAMDDLRDSSVQLNATKSAVNKEAANKVIGDIPKWIGQLDTTNPAVAAAVSSYNAAIGKGAKPLDAISAIPALAQQFAGYAGQMHDVYANQIFSSKGYKEDADAATAKAAAAHLVLSNMQKTDPDYADAFMTASQNYTMDQSKKAEKAAQIADGIRNGTIDPNTQKPFPLDANGQPVRTSIATPQQQAAANTAAQVAMNAANKARQMHAQAAQSLLQQAQSGTVNAINTAGSAIGNAFATPLEDYAATPTALTGATGAPPPLPTDIAARIAQLRASGWTPGPAARPPVGPVQTVARPIVNPLQIPAGTGTLTNGVPALNPLVPLSSLIGPGAPYYVPPTNAVTTASSPATQLVAPSGASDYIDQAQAQNNWMANQQLTNP